MSRGREVELTISSAKNIKNVNWRNGQTRPYAVVWVDPRNKCSSRVDEEGDTSPKWNERIVIPLPQDNNDDDDKLHIDIVHAGQEADTKPLIGSASLKLSDVLQEVGFGVPFEKSLKLKRPSGRPQGKLDVTVTILEPRYHPAPRSYQAEPYGAPYGAPPQHEYGAQYGQTQYGQPQYGQPQYGQQYGQPQHGGGYSHSGGYEYKEEKDKDKESKFGGMGTGIAIGAVAGVLGGIAISEGYDAITDDIAEEAAERVEEEEGGDDSDGGDDSE